MAYIDNLLLLYPLNIKFDQRAQILTHKNVLAL